MQCGDRSFPSLVAQFGRIWFGSGELHGDLAQVSTSPTFLQIEMVNPIKKNGCLMEQPQVRLLLEADPTYT